MKEPEQAAAFEEAIVEINRERARCLRLQRTAVGRLYERYTIVIETCDALRERLRALSPLLTCGHVNDSSHEGSPCQSGEVDIEEKLQARGYSKLTERFVGAVRGDDKVILYADDGMPACLVLGKDSGVFGVEIQTAIVNRSVYGVYRKVAR